MGVVVGAIEPKGQRVIAYGKLDSGNSQPLNGDTIFEIGSITKVFTSLLLADMVNKGEVQLSDPISKYLPPGVKAPSRNGKNIRNAALDHQRLAKVYCRQFYFAARKLCGAGVRLFVYSR